MVFRNGDELCGRSRLYQQRLGVIGSEFHIRRREYRRRHQQQSGEPRGQRCIGFLGRGDRLTHAGHHRLLAGLGGDHGGARELDADGVATYRFYVEFTDHNGQGWYTTNGISFSAKVVPAKRLTMTSSTPNGKVTYRGVPQKPIGAAISGSWQGNKKENKQEFLELFNLLPYGEPNIYFTTNGQGPNMTFFGWAVVSVQKKIGFAFETFPGVITNFTDASGGKLSATYGPVSYPKTGAKGNTKGFEEPMTPISFNIRNNGSMATWPGITSAASRL